MLGWPGTSGSRSMLKIASTMLINTDRNSI